MMDRQKTVPRTAAQRLGRMARLAGGVAGGMLAEGARSVRDGRQLRVRDLILTPGNARRLTKQLSEMRGAAMKLGQILSMDGGDFLPPELTEILATLRSGAFAMPDWQLEQMLSEAFGDDWSQKLRDFEAKPFAAASIGQVHRLKTRDGRDAVLKVQYPGVAESVDADVDNLLRLLKISGLLPPQMDVAPLLAEVKRQLKEEADYTLEGKYLSAFVRALGDDERFLLPRMIPSLSSERVLGMTYVDSVPIEAVLDECQEERDRVMSLLIELLMVELFDLRMVQTDPNFANYRYQPETGQVVLLDFGATRRFRAGFIRGYQGLLSATLAGDREAMASAAADIGYAIGPPGSRYREIVLDVIEVALDPIMEDGPYDFGNSTLGERLLPFVEVMRDYREFWEAPPVDAAYIHRKIGGLFQLAQRLGARVNVNALLRMWLQQSA
jgi:predicted unusual protein kinase regulating ubiquinone biosynthesis (AarF/ABC1/UbiB family)